MDMDDLSNNVIAGSELDVSVQKVLQNTYMLLGATIGFSAVMAGASILLRVPYMGLWMLLPYFGLLWMVEKNKNNSSGIAWCFALTGFLGVTLGPILSAVLALRGAEPIMLALGSTALTFFAASAYVLQTRKKPQCHGRVSLHRLNGRFCWRDSQYFSSDPCAGPDCELYVCYSLHRLNYVADEYDHSRW